MPISSENISEKLKRIFIKSLGLQQNIILDHLVYNEIPEWDSIAHMTLVSDIEAEFDIMLDSADVIALNNFPKALQLVAKYLP